MDIRSDNILGVVGCKIIIRVDGSFGVDMIWLAGLAGYIYVKINLLWQRQYRIETFLTYWVFLC